MSSAAAKLLALPELLELVLLEMYDEDGERCIEDLFTLQRVNRTFHRTILGSFRLRQQMGLEYPLFASTPGLAKTSIGISSSKLRLLGRAGIYLDSPHVLEPRCNVGNNTTCASHSHLLEPEQEDPTLFLTWPPESGMRSYFIQPTSALRVARPDPDMLAPTESKAGRERICAPPSSWRKIKFLGKPQKCILRISVGFPSPPDVGYDLSLLWDVGSDSLGAISDAFEGLLNRTAVQHQDFGTKQRSTRIYCIISHDVFCHDRLRSPPSQASRAIEDIVRDQQPAKQKVMRRWLEMKAAHDRLADCGRSLGNCHICHAEGYYANRNCHNRDD